MPNTITRKDMIELDDLDKELALLKAELKVAHSLNPRANFDNIANAIEDNILPLFIFIEEKCDGLNEFFFDTVHKISFEIEGEIELQHVGSSKSQREQLKTNWLQNQIKKDKKKITKLQYNFELRGFKKSISSNSVWTTVQVWFNDYYYTLQTSCNNHQIQYGKKLAPVELQKLATPLIKDIINGVKGLMSNSN